MNRLAILTAASLPLFGAAASAQPVNTVVVETARLLETPATTTLVGTVVPIRRSLVASQLAGIVTEMPVREGDTVSKGDILCRLDVIALMHQIAEAQANWNARKAFHAELLAGTRPEELQRSKALLDEAASEYDRWNFEMARVKRLFESGEANEKEIHDTRASFLAALRRKIAAQASYDLAVAGPRDEEIARATYEAAQRKAVLDRLNSDLEKSAIRAPFTGHIIALRAEVGQWIPQGGPVLEMTDTSSVLVRVDVPETGFPFLKVGQRADIWIDALNESFDGTVRHIIRQADDTARTFPTEIEIANQEGRLGGGMFARASVIVGPQEKVTAVPKDAIVERNGVAQVAIVGHGKDGATVATLVTVRVGQDIGTWVSIRSGNIKPGMIIITKGNENILPFPTPVQIVNQLGQPKGKPVASRTAADLEDRSTNLAHDAGGR